MTRNVHVSRFNLCDAALKCCTTFEKKQQTIFMPKTVVNSKSLTNTREVSVWCVLFLRNENSLLTLRNGRFVLFLGNWKDRTWTLRKIRKALLEKLQLWKGLEKASIVACASALNSQKLSTKICIYLMDEPQIVASIEMIRPIRTILLISNSESRQPLLWTCYQIN